MKTDNFYQEDLSALRKILEQQLQNHFNDLVKLVPSIEEIVWNSAQEDENFYALINFELTKYNGYRYEYSLMQKGECSSSEFTEEELFLITEFINYIENSSKLFVIIWGNMTCVLNAE